MWVTGRSDSALSGMSVSTRTGPARPSWTSQTAAREVALLGQLDRDGQRLAILAEDAQDGQLSQVLWGGVLLVTVCVDRLADVAMFVEETQPTNGMAMSG